MNRLKEVLAENSGRMKYEWGVFSKDIPGRSGYQCSNLYRTLLKSGQVLDENFVKDEKGSMRPVKVSKGRKRKEMNDEADSGEVKPEGVGSERPSAAHVAVVGRRVATTIDNSMTNDDKLVANLMKFLRHDNGNRSVSVSYSC